MPNPEGCDESETSDEIDVVDHAPADLARGREGAILQETG